MNDKQAKRVRRLAEEVYAELDTPEPQGSYMQHRRDGNIVNHPLSLRGVIRRVKREVARGNA